MNHRFFLAIALTTAPLVAGCSTSASPGEGDTSSSESDLSKRAIPVYLNHTYGMLSPATIDALQTNHYLADQFVDVEVRTTVTPGLSWTGTYLNMRETYLELFPVGTFGYPGGVFGVGLGVDAAGGIEALQSRWQAELGADQVALNPKLHAVDGVQVPWFRNLTLSWSDSSNYAAIWGMEYYPNPGSTKPHTRFEERAVRYAPHKLARNVSAAVYGVEAGDAALLRRTLSSAGWKVREEGAGFVSLSPRDAGVRRQLHFRIASADHLGLLGLKIQLNRYAQHTEQLGDAVLTVGANWRNQAYLWFVTPSAAEQDLLDGVHSESDDDAAAD